MATIGIFVFSAGAWRLLSCALRAPPEIFLFAQSELKTAEDPKKPKRHRRRLLETAPGGFGCLTTKNKGGRVGKKKEERGLEAAAAAPISLTHVEISP